MSAAPAASPEPGTDAAPPARCPLCGGDNACALERERQTGQPQPPCWCVQAQFSPELLARVPVAARGLACVCVRCATGAGSV